MSELKMLGKLPKEFSKSEIEQLAVQDINAVLSNEKYDLLKVLVELKRYEVYLNKLIESIRSPALEKAKLIDDKKKDFGYAKISLSRRVVYDYKVDKTWNELNNKLSSIKDRIKLHQNFLKNLTEECIEIIDEGSGEIIVVNAAVKKETETLLIKF